MKNNYKIKSHFTSFINKIYEKKVDKPDDLESKAINVYQNNKFINNIKIESDDINKVIKMKDFLNEIDGNVELLQKLSVDRLKQLEKYYNNIIEENKIKISKLS